MTREAPLTERDLDQSLEQELSRKEGYRVAAVQLRAIAADIERGALRLPEGLTASRFLRDIAQGMEQALKVN